MPFLYWAQVAAYSIYLIGNTAFAFMVIGAGPTRPLNRAFALSALSGTCWAFAALVVQVSLHLGFGNPTLWLELATMGLSLMAPALLLFSTHAVQVRSVWPQRAAVFGFATIALLCIPLFRHELIQQPQLHESGMISFDVTRFGQFGGIVVMGYLAWSVVIFVRNARRRGEVRLLAFGTLLILFGFLLGGVLRRWFPYPILPFSVTISMAVFGYVTVRNELFDPLRELTRDLENTVRERTREQVETAKRLEEANRALERRAAQMEALREIGLELSSQLDLSTLLQSIAARAVELLAGIGGGIYLLKQERLELEWSVAVGVDQPAIGATLKRGEGLAGKVWDTGRPFIVQDYRQWEGKAEQYADYPWGAIASVPIQWGNELLGVLDVHAAREQPMTDRDTDSLSLLTSQAAVALRNANALAKEERLRRRAESLVEATTALTSTLELEQLLENILRAAARSIPAAEKGSILLQEAESSSLTMRALIGYDDPRVREVSFAKSEGYSAEVAEKGKPVIVRDARAAPFCYEGEIAEMRAVQSAVAVPLVYKEKTIGVLALDNAHRKNAFAEKDLNLLSAFADQAAMAIENARLFEQHGRRITELSIINEIGRAVSAAFDRDALFQTLREQISRVFDITNFYLATYDVARSEWCSVVHFEHGKEQPLGTYEAGSGLTGFIIRSRKPILLRSREENLAFKKTQGIEAIGELAGSWLGVPLRVGEQVIGVMGVQDYEEEGRYDENDLVVFSTIASQVAIALANLYLLEESQERAKELELINDVGKTVASILDLRQVFRAIVDATKSRFGFFFVGILGIEQGKVVLLDGSTIGRSRNRLGQGILISDAKGERGLVAAAIRSKKEVLVNDVHNDGRYIEYSKLEATQSELCVPILMQDRVIGAFDVQSDRTDAFDDRSVGLLQALASHAGVAIENARLYESVRQELAERKRTERALRESEHRYREVVENAEDIIYTCDINGNYLFVNEAGRQVSGYSHEELKGMNYLELIVTEHRRRVQIHYMRQFLSKEPTSYVEYPFLTKAGEVVWLAQNASIMMTEGEVVGFHIYARNITERLQAEAALQRERETFYSILESAPYGVVLLDGRIIGYLNPAFTSISGYTIADIQTTDQYFERCFGRSVLRDEIEKHSNKQANAAPHEVYSLTASDGSTKNVEVTWATLEDGRVLMMLDDVTERQRLESRLREAQRLEAVGRLAGGIAHDFNNILTAITGYADFVLTGLEEVDPLSNDVIEIRKAAKRASKLTSQLLAFSRRQMLQVKIVDLNVLIADMQNMLRRLIGEDVELRADLASHLHQVKADPGQIEQVVMNLIVNAREAMPDGGQITVGTENVEQTEEFGQIDSETRTGRFVRVFVEDTGTGMDQETAKQVFEPFFSTKEAGTGLGLSVVYGIVKQHGGWIEVESEIGCGSIFRMYLPAVLSKPTTVERPVSETAASRGGTERILLVEDEQGVRRFVSRVLGRNGYHVDAVSTVAEAIKLFEHNEGEFDLLLSDVVLPDRSGVELADHLLSQKPNIRILLSSGYSDQKSQWPRIQEKGYRFLQKPYDLSVLLATVRDVLEADSLPRSSLGH